MAGVVPFLVALVEVAVQFFDFLYILKKRLHVRLAVREVVAHYTRFRYSREDFAQRCFPTEYSLDLLLQLGVFREDLPKLVSLLDDGTQSGRYSAAKLG